MKISPANKASFPIVIFCLAAAAILIGGWKTHPRPNIMVIVLDAVRPDHLGCYGYNRNTSPHIDRLAGDGTRFLNAFSVGSWTGESVPSILTGANPFQHRVSNWGQPISVKVKTLSEILGEAGYRTLFASAYAGLKCMDFQRGFQEVYWAADDDRPYKQEAMMTGYLKNWFKSDRSRRPFFMYLHFHASHSPYRLPANLKNTFLDDGFSSGLGSVPIGSMASDRSYAQNRGIGNIPFDSAEDGITDPDYYIAQYDAAIYHADALLGQLFDTLKSLKIYDSTLIIVTADHGEMLGEHGIYLKHGEPYEECRRVPLVIRMPGANPGPQEVARPVSLLDIGPTILKYARLGQPPYMEGRDLCANRIFPANDRDFLFTHIGIFLSLTSGQWKLVSRGPAQWELYNLKDDPQERSDIAASQRRVLDNLRLRLQRLEEQAGWDPAAVGSARLNDEQKKKMRALGYLN